MKHALVLIFAVVLLLQPIRFFQALAEEEEEENLSEAWVLALAQRTALTLLDDELSNEPAMIHASWQHDPAHTMTVTWQTDDGNNPHQVRYGLTNQYELGSVTGSGQASPFSGTLHLVELLTLTAGTTYHYSVSGNDGVWSADFTFTTGPDGYEPLTFAVCGDSREWLPWPLGNLDGLDNLMSMIEGRTSRFLLFTGDMCYDAVTEAYWSDWFSIVQPYAGSHAFMPCPGNHEYESDDAAAHYQGMFTLPAGSGSELWYSFDYGPMHIISLDTELTADAGQRTWLEADLATTQADWILVFFHNPPYCSGFGISFHSPDAAVQQNWVTLFDTYHVDVVFNGHNHFYERTFPLFGGNDPSHPTVTDSSPHDYSNPTGTIYMVVGAAGAPTLGYNPDNSSGYIASSRSFTNHAAFLSLTAPNVLSGQVISDSGSTIDTFSITKSLPTPTPPPSPTRTPTVTATPSPTRTPSTRTPAPTGTRSPTPSRTATRTPARTATLTPTRTPARTATPTRSPTPHLSPTFTPPSSPTRTPTPAATATPGALSVDIACNQRYYRPGDRFLLTNTITNSGPATTIDVYIVLDVYGAYWFWPDWQQEADHAQRQLAAHDHVAEQILDFQWPDGAGQADNLSFWAGLTEPFTVNVLAIDRADFGYNP